MILAKNIIRIPGKDFDDLNAQKASRMIEADPSLSPGVGRIVRFRRFGCVLA